MQVKCKSKKNKNPVSTRKTRCFSADSDSEGRGFESLRAGQKKQFSLFVRAAFFRPGNSNPERVSGVKKTWLRHVFSREVRSSYAARTDSARQSRCDVIPPGRPKTQRSLMWMLCFLFPNHDKKAAPTENIGLSGYTSVFPQYYWTFSAANASFFSAWPE